MKKIVNVLKSSFNIIFFVSFIFMIISVLFFNNMNGYKFNIPILMIGIVIFIIVVYFMNKLFHKISKKATWIILGIGSLLMLAIQVICAIYLRVTPTWDFGAVSDIAIEYVTTGKADFWYLERYTNNIGIAVLLIAIFKIASWIHFTDFVLVGMIVNIIFIDLAILFTFLCAKKILGLQKATVITGLLMIMTPIFFYVPIYYTDTLSMLFPVLLFYLYECRKGKKKTVGYDLAIGITAFIGINIKFTIIIVYIAILLYEFLQLPIETKETFKQRGFSFLKLMGIPILVIVMFSIFKSAFTNKMIKDTEAIEREKFPLTHWIMMGLTVPNGYYHPSVEFTGEFPTVEEKQQANLMEIKRLLQTNGPRFYWEKLKYTWGDGTFTAAEKLRREPVRTTRLHSYILASGDKNQYYLYFSQIQMISIWVLIAFSSFSLSKRKETENSLYFIGRICIIGLMAFFMLWEPRARYLVNFIPIFVLTSYGGIEVIQNTLRKGKEKWSKIKWMEEKR